MFAFRLAKTVSIVVVTDGKMMPMDNPGLKLVGYVGTHDIEATVALVQSSGQ